MEEVGEVLILEQFLRTLSPEVGVWVKEHNPQNRQKATQLVEAFMLAWKGPKVFRYDRIHRPTTPKGKSVGFVGGGPSPSEETPVNALLDSASTQTLVLPYLIQQQQFGDGEVDVWYVHGDKRPYPTAHVYLEVQGQSYFLEVGVVPALSHPVLLGHDIPILPRLLQESKPVNMMVTRAKARNVAR